MQNPVNHLGWSFLQKQSTTFSPLTVLAKRFILDI